MSFSGTASAGRRSYVRTALMLTTVSLTFSMAIPAREGRAEEAPNSTMSVDRIAAERRGGIVKISGWATFSGQTMGSMKDPNNDGATAAEPGGAEIIRSDFTYRPENQDFFFRLEVTKIPSFGVGVGGLSSAGDPNTLYGLIFTAKNVPYQIRAHKLGPTEAGEPTGPAFGLFKCTEVTCIHVADLKGGYGATGERIVVSLPLKVLHEDGTNIHEGDLVGELHAYTSIGQFLSGPAPGGELDGVRLIKSASVEVPRKSIVVTVGEENVRAQLEDGYFVARFPAHLFKNPPTTVTTKTCLGRKCIKQTFKVRR